MISSPRFTFRLTVLCVGMMAFAASAAFAETPAAEVDPSLPKIDFACVCYGGLGRMPPPVFIKATAQPDPKGGDDTVRLQVALDYLASLPADETGWRGALQLAAGKYRVGGQLRLRAGGVALYGTALPGDPAAPKTVIVAAGQSRRALVEIGATEPAQTGPAIRIADETVPVGSRDLTLENLTGVDISDRIVVTRPSTAEWIKALGMTGFKGSFAALRLDWTPGSRDLVWDRRIAGIDPDSKRIVLDAPITCALERRYGGGTVAKVVKNEPITHIAVANVTLESEYDSANPRDEAHAWDAIALDRAEDVWINGVTARHFAGSAVRVGPRARRVSVIGCRNEQPVSEPGGYRRQSFLVEGQQTLVQDCSAENGVNDFALGLCAAGPNVFYQCAAKHALGASGAAESLAAGALYEDISVEGAGLRLTRDTDRTQGAGWTAVNSAIVNGKSDATEARGPDDAPNVALSGKAIYAVQLRNHPERRMLRQPLPSTDGAPTKTFDEPSHFPLTSTEEAQNPPLEIVNGRFVVDGRVLWGGQVNDAWWRGQANPATALDAGVSLTRFVPGRTGPGLTEDLPDLAKKMADDRTPFYEHWPALWYDRRRDEHSLTARTDANAWAPFYEMPWARSGQGTAWDGLSRYDLTRYNPWYYARLREFAWLCSEHGLMLRHELYNTHNTLETAAHWTDFPWRPANCINETGLPDPLLNNEKSVHLTNQFYDVENPKLRALHRAFILHELDELGAEPNVILGAGFQFTGPLAFQQFFQDTVAEWEKQHGKTLRLSIMTSKDITDAILADPVRSKQIAVIDMRYWQYMPDGTLFAPPGGQNLAFREMIAKQFSGKSGDAPPPTSPEQIYRQVREYRDRFPDKAIVAWNGGAGPIPVLMAGGAQALMRNPAAGNGQGRQVDRTPLDGFVQERLAAALPTMNPRSGALTDPTHNWCLADGKSERVLLYSLTGAAITLDQSLPGKAYQGTWFDPRTGKTEALQAAPASWEKGTSLPKPSEADWLLLLQVKG